MPLTKEQVTKIFEEHKATMKKDPTAGGKMFADNAKILPNHCPAVSGKAAIEAHHKEKAAKFADFDIKHTVEDVLNEGDLAIVDGTMVISKGGTELDTGKFMTILKKDGDSYKILRMMHNTNRPHPDMKCS